MNKINKNSLYIDPVSILNNNEKEFIFSTLNIENHSKSSSTKFKIWFDHF